MRELSFACVFAVSTALANCAIAELANSETIAFDTTEVTYSSIDYHTTSRSVIFHVLGHIYSLEEGNSKAKKVTSGLGWDHSIRVSPDGKQLAFGRIADDGTEGVWVGSYDDRNFQMVAPIPASNIDWLNSEELLVFDHVRRTTVLIDVSTGKFGDDPRLEGVGSDFAVSQDREQLIFSELSGAGNDRHLSVLDVATGNRRTIVSRPGRTLFRPQFGANDESVYFVEADANVSSLWRMDLDGRRFHKIIPLDYGHRVAFARKRYGYFPNFRVTEKGRIAIATRGRILMLSKRGDVVDEIGFVADIERHVRPIVRPQTDRYQDEWASPEVQGRFIRWPTVSPDGMSDAVSVFGRIYVRESGRIRHELRSATGFYHAPVFAPDGQRLAFVERRRDGSSSIFEINLRTGSVAEIYFTPKLADRGAVIASPQYSPDGEQIAFWQADVPKFPSLNSPLSSGTSLILFERATGLTHELVGLREPRFTINSRFPTLSFSDDSERIYFLQGANDPLRLGKELVYFDRKTNVLEHVMLLPSRIDDAVVSPIEEMLALRTRRDVVLLEYPKRERRTGGPVFAKYKTTPFDPSIKIQRLNEDWAMYPRWTYAGDLIWGGMGGYVRWRPGSRKAEFNPVDGIALQKHIETPPSWVIANVNIVDVIQGTSRPNGFVIVEKGVIAAIGFGSPPNPSNHTFVIDGGNRYLVPGFIDTHSHFDPLLGHESEYWSGRFPQFLAVLKYGVTTHFDPNAREVDAVPIQELIDAGVVRGPKVFSTGRAILGLASRYPNYLEENLTSLEDARRLARQYREVGALMLKSYLLQSRVQQQWLLLAARENGLGVTAEGRHTLEQNLLLVVDGHTSIEHFYFEGRLYEDVLEFLKRSNVSWNGTLLIQKSMGARLISALHCLVSPEVAKIIEFEDRADCDKIDKTAILGRANTLVSLLKAGVNVDIGAHGNFPGLGTHLEMLVYSLAGASPNQVLRAATINGATKLNLEKHLGSIDVGKQSNLVLLNCNPLERTANTTAVAAVFTPHFFVSYDSSISLE